MNCWCQLAQPGDTPVDDSLVQVVDQTSAEAIVATFQADRARGGRGLLVDADHYSDLTDDERRQLDAMGIQLPCQAMGWITDMRVTDGVPWGLLEFTPEGAASVAGGEYVFLSPVFPRSAFQPVAGNRERPMRMSKVALTNEPRMSRIPAIMNRGSEAATTAFSGASVSLANRAEVVSAAIGVDNAILTSGENMDAIRTALKLDAKADEPACVAAITAIQNRCVALEAEKTTIENRATAAEKIVLDQAIAGDLETFKDVIASPDEVRAQLVANREGTIKTLKALRKPAAATVPNRRDGKVPGEKDEPQSADAKRSSTIRNRAHAIMRSEHGVNFQQAFKRAENENPA